jgi:DNA-directed RNA polymerase subunit RPC12/RpoP
MITTELKCMICGAKIGQYDFNEDLHPVSKMEKSIADFIDIRCDSCLITHGSFQELTADFIKQTGQTPNEAESFVKANRKRADFDKELKKL